MSPSSAAVATLNIANIMSQKNVLVVVTMSSFCWTSAQAKGGAVRGAAAGSAVCTDCTGNYTAEEMQVALVVLIIIMLGFLAVCGCQCYQRAMWEYTGHKGKRPMPVAPYDREDGRFNV